MTLGRLINLLEDLAETLGDDAEVRIAEQPEWPFEYTLQGVATREDVRQGADEDEKRDHEGDTDVVLVAGRQIGYASKALWDVARR
jgi:hypothetical protein